MGFYEKFLSLCENAGKTPSAVATAIGLNSSSVTYWKRGSQPKAGTVVKLADFFGVSIEYLLDENAGRRSSQNEPFHVKAPQIPVLRMSDAYKVEQVQIDYDGRVTVIYNQGQKGLSVCEFQKLMAFVTRLSDEYSISTEDILEIMDFTTRTVAKTAKIIQMTQSSATEQNQITTDAVPSEESEGE